jgi:hypothetical protein
VAATEHIRDSVFVALPDGTAVPYDSADRKFDEERAEIWARDLLFALNQLSVLAGTEGSPFRGTIDVTRAGAFGHSFGGRAAATACILDSRLKACLNEDGTGDEGQRRRPYWPIQGRRLAGTFAMFDWFDSGLEEQDFAAMHTTLADFAAARLRVSGEALDVYQNALNGSYRLTLLEPGMSHTAFTDLRWLTAEGNRPLFARYLESIRRTVRLFFDGTVKEKSVPSFKCGAVTNAVFAQCYSASPGSRR